MPINEDEKNNTIILITNKKQSELEAASIINFDFNQNTVIFDDLDITEIVNNAAAKAQLNLQTYGLNSEDNQRFQAVIDGYKRLLLNEIYVDISQGNITRASAIDASYLNQIDTYTRLNGSVNNLINVINDPTTQPIERAEVIEQAIPKSRGPIAQAIVRSLKAIAIVAIPTIGFAAVGGTAGGLTSLITGPLAPATFWGGFSVGATAGAGVGLLTGLSLLRQYGTNLSKKEIMEVTSDKVLSMAQNTAGKVLNQTEERVNQKVDSASSVIHRPGSQ